MCVVLPCDCPPCSNGHPAFCEWEDEPGSEDEGQYIYDTADGDPETLRTAAFERLQPVRGFGNDPRTDFDEFLDREKGKIFKQCWYAAIVDPEERAKYEATNALVDGLGKQQMAKKDVQFSCRMLIWLLVHMSHHRVVWKDAIRAFQTMALFFDSGDQKSDLPLVSQLAENAARATNLPYSRSFQSNLLLPAKFWREADEFDERRQQVQKRRGTFYDREGDKFMRSTIAHWFKAGVICPAHVPYPPGNAVVIHEQGKEQPNLFIDYRAMKDDWPVIGGDFKAVTNPNSVDILHAARIFNSSNPSARFALLRIWSHSHFYPLMLSWDNRINTTFQDEISRSWSWKFVPKDMPGSEWSIQKGVDLRIDTFRKQFGKQVVVKRDMVLVMAKDEEELKRFEVGVCYAIQTKPWRMDVDLWKSFVNVPLNFLERLDKAWLE